MIRLADTPGGVFCVSARGRVTLPVDIRELDCFFGIFNADNEVDRRISGGVCVDARFIPKSLLVDGDFLIFTECDD